MALAVKVEAVATPAEVVVTVVTLLDVAAKVPLAPLAGAVKVTVTPCMGLENWSTTDTFRLVA